MKRHFVYGPVPSRRLGRSLGVDLLPFKTCTYDCIYCQLGRTTNKTEELDEYVPVDEVLAEVASKLESGPRPDFISLAGSGEPTLHGRIGDVIAGIKAMTAVPVAVITNGSLLWRPEVRSALAQADLVMPSLDAGSREAFERVNRPHGGVPFEVMVEGLIAFAREFRGKVWLEVFVVGGITDREDEVRRIADIVERMGPDRVQLNTVSRPPAERYAMAVPRERLEALCGLFTVPCEVIAEGPKSERVEVVGGRDVEDEIVTLLSRRPCTVEGIATGLGMAPNEVVKHLDALCQRGSVRQERQGEAVFYEVIAGGDQPRDPLGGSPGRGGRGGGSGG